MGETTRIENNEYGYCSLIKATKRVLEKLEIENKTAATITPVERIKTPLWLYNQRAEYGKQVVKNLATKLIIRYGTGWSEKKLRHCLRNAETIDMDSFEKSYVYKESA